MDGYIGTQNICYVCRKNNSTSICQGCNKTFCDGHINRHRQELSQQMMNIEKQYNILREDIHSQNVNNSLLAQIERWEEESINKIRLCAEKVRADVKRFTEESTRQLNDLMNRLASELQISRYHDSFTEINISQWELKLQQLRQDLDMLSKNDLIQKDNTSCLPLIIFKSYDKTIDNKTTSPLKNRTSLQPIINEVNLSREPRRNGHLSTENSDISHESNASLPMGSSSFLSLTFGFERCDDGDIKNLFKHLMTLSPMNKNGPLSGRCEAQTGQMETFLSNEFGFENIPGQCIVPGVKSFRLKRYPYPPKSKTKIHFPFKSANSFQMTAQEITDWQHSYRVYTWKQFQDISKPFLSRALRGESRSGAEAFRMKFVIRISTCPILMDFDSQVISRQLNEDWPSKIKLVSVTGVDFAGREHDVADIVTYVLNWKDIYEIDRYTGLPFVHNGRDFLVRRGAPPVKLDEDQLFKDLKIMARLRLRACDQEGVQIVVETGIGLGVFSGEHIRIDGRVRHTSALAIRTVLEEDGPTYKHIRAIVFALPIFDERKRRAQTENAFHDFFEEFQTPEYNGPIPVLIADQDMLRLTVAIARQGFIVSQLNPADSHGVFGEYWQNRGPAVEEKLALTTLGLLVQHHLFNPQVLNPDNYNFIQVDI